jgi:hypothetical protein
MSSGGVLFQIHWTAAMRYLCTIEDVFLITGRGCVVVPGIPTDLPQPPRAGAKLLVRQPDGKTLEAMLHGVEMIRTDRPMDHIAFTFPPHITKSDLLIGSEVFVLD